MMSVISRLRQRELNAYILDRLSGKCPDQIKVVFVEPRASGHHVYTGVRIPRLGVLILATILHRRGYKVSVVIEDILPKEDCHTVSQEIDSADVVCISTTTSTAPRAYHVADMVPAGKLIIMGGIHASYFPEEVLHYAHLVFLGEADETFPRLFELLRLGCDWRHLPGIAFRSAGRLQIGAPASPPKAQVLNELPYPDYGLLAGFDRGGVFSIQTARGCPYDCSFCSVTGFNGKEVRRFSPDWVVEAITEHWNDYQPRYIFFADDIFNVFLAEKAKILEELIRRGIRPQFGFGAQVRHELSRHGDFLSLMKRAGWDRVMIGVESINQASLDLCGKRESVAEATEAIHVFHQYGIKVHGMFVVGFDTDTKKTIRDTLRFANKHRIDSFQLMILTPLPGSEDWRKQGLQIGQPPLLTSDWGKFDAHHAVFAPAGMSAYDLNIETLKAMKKFYSWPRIIGRLLVGDLVEAGLRFQARKPIHAWEVDPDNRQYLDFLRGHR